MAVDQAEQDLPEMSVADVLHLLVDHGRFPEESQVRAAHRAVVDHFGPFDDVHLDDDAEESTVDSTVDTPPPPPPTRPPTSKARTSTKSTS